MKEDLMEILACPVCKGELTLKVTEKEGDEIIEGVIRCKKCKAGYPVEDGIPNMLPADMR